MAPCPVSGDQKKAWDAHPDCKCASCFILRAVAKEGPKHGRVADWEARLRRLQRVHESDGKEPPALIETDEDSDSDLDDGKEEAIHVAADGARAFVLEPVRGGEQAIERDRPIEFNIHRVNAARHHEGWFPLAVAQEMEADEWDGRLHAIDAPEMGRMLGDNLPHVWQREDPHERFARMELERDAHRRARARDAVQNMIFVGVAVLPDHPAARPGVPGDQDNPVFIQVGDNAQFRWPPIDAVAPPVAMDAAEPDERWAREAPRNHIYARDEEKDPLFAEVPFGLHIQPMEEQVLGLPLQPMGVAELDQDIVKREARAERRREREMVDPYDFEGGLFPPDDPEPHGLYPHGLYQINGPFF